MRASTYLPAMVETNQPQSSPPLFSGRLRNLDQARLLAEGWVEAHDDLTDNPTWVALEKRAQNPSLATIVGLEHAHLAPVVAVIEREDSWLVLTKVIRGVPLKTRVGEIGRKHAVDSVRTALRVADALSHLHDAGVVHGRVNPDNVLLGLQDGVEPALIFGAPSGSEYLRPDRDPADAKLDPRDDTWAATALLYFMLSGNPPPSHGLDSVSELEDLRIDDTLLCEVLLHGLASDENRRSKNLTALKRELARWFIAHAADEPMPVGNFSHKPPPLPPSVAPKPRRTFSSRAPKGSTPAEPPVPATSGPGWMRSVPIALIAAVIGIGVAWGLSRVSKSSKEKILIREKAVAASSTPVASTGPIDLAEVPVTGKEQAAGDPTSSCMRGYLREGTLTKHAQLDVICREPELPRALGTLRLAFASTAGGAPTNAVRFDSLGWYSLPLLDAMRQACCTDPPALKLPDLGDACPEFPKALEQLAHIASTTQQFNGSLEAFSEAARCAVRTGRASGISGAPPSPAAENAFRELFATSGNP